MAELEEYARQYEVTGRGCRAARATPASSGRESVMTVVSGQGRESVVSGVSDSSSVDTLRPSSHTGSSHSPHLSQQQLISKDEIISRSSVAGLPSITSMVSGNNHELRDRSGGVYTRMRPVFSSSSAYNDGRRKSDFYSFSSSTGGYYRPSERPDNSRVEEETWVRSVSDRIHQMEKLTAPQPSQLNSSSAARHKATSEDDSHLSKSVPNLLSENDPDEASEDGNNKSNDNCEPSYTYLDPEKKCKVTDNTLKLIQKQAVLDYYTRQKKSSTDLTKELTRNQSLHNRSSEDAEDSKNSSFESERRFLRSISQGSLSGISVSSGQHNGESYISLQQSPGRQHNSSNNQRQMVFNNDRAHHQVKFVQNKMLSSVPTLVTHTNKTHTDFRLQNTASHSLHCLLCPSFLICLIVSQT